MLLLGDQVSLVITTGILWIPIQSMFLLNFMEPKPSKVLSLDLQTSTPLTTYTLYSLIWVRLMAIFKQLEPKGLFSLGERSSSRPVLHNPYNSISDWSLPTFMELLLHATGVPALCMLF